MKRLNGSGAMLHREEPDFFRREEEDVADLP